ncbi:DUF3710 domain-containing protein [Rhizohabitans arisaemae]|uniref:DUF3710 domain-containing protein n=1 Tax=Rhizohabitans arisaemae TaxID=2720610 RepID=UPI0024B2031D|nr:DUF3710 domain-containing protein [Rhizohabitans arisaemae]
MFRRRRREEPGEEIVEPAEQEGAAPGRTQGPWDEADDVPEHDRIDLGGMRVPISQDFEVQVNLAEDQVVAATVLTGESALQIQAFAAPKKSGIWDDLRREIADEVASSGGTTEEAEGPFGAELEARIPVEDAGEQAVRFLGVDGPRWFLRGVISGKAALDREAAALLEDAFAGVVVVRGAQPMAPKELIGLRLPTEALQALEEHNAQQNRAKLNPFERGPEITEIR